MKRKTFRRTPFDPIVIPPYSLGGFVMCGCAGPGHKLDCMTQKPSRIQMAIDYAGFLAMTWLMDCLDAWRRLARSVDWFRLTVFAVVAVVYGAIIGG